MIKKIFIVLALASLFVSTHAAYVAITCADSNCASCPSSIAATCTACNSGYFLASGACTACAGTGCATCTAATAGTCTAAMSGYFLAANPGTPAACSGTTSTTVYTCSVCTAATAGTCTAAMSGYFLAANPGTPAACFDTGCATCTAATTGTCTAAMPGYFLAANPGTPAACSGTTSTTVYTCSVCTAATAGTCTTQRAGYFLSANPGTPTQCGDTFNAAACSAVDTATTCTKGTLGSGICCGVPNCGTCATSAVAGATGANAVCATCSGTYTLFSGVCNCVANCLTCTSGTVCTVCATGYALTGTAPTATCVATTPVPSTNSPSSAFNVTPTAVFMSTDTTAPAFSGLSSTMVVYGPGFDSTTAYVWAVIAPTLTTGTYAVNRRTINATGFAKSNSSADTAISTSIPSSSIQDLAVGPGYLAIASYVAGANWNNVGGTATASEISVTYIAVNGSSATTKPLTGNTNTNVFFDVEDIWYLNGTIYVAYTMMTRTVGTATVADTFAANGIYIQGVVVSTGALLYNTTGGVKAITLTQSTTGTIGLTCTVGTNCASTPSSSVAEFSVGAQNFTAQGIVSYLWEDQSTANAYTIKMGTINVTSGVATTGTTLTTTAAPTGSGTVASPTITTSYSIAGFFGSSGSYGAFINKMVNTNTGVVASTTTVYTVMAYINGSSTASGNVTVASGYMPSSIQGFGTSDGYLLVETQSSMTTVTTGQSTLIQVERFFTNGSVALSAVSLGTYSNTPQVYQDTNGSIILGYTTVDTLTSKTYAGYLGLYLSQSLAAASTLTSIFAFLSLLIVALFAF